MMRDTPRTFVGTVALRLEGPVTPAVRDALHEGLALLRGVRVSELDAGSGTLMVTAERPVDRAEVTAALCRLGCPVCD